MSSILSDPLYEKIQLIEKYESKKNDTILYKLGSEVFNMIQQDNPELIYQVLFSNPYIKLTKEKILEIHSLLNKYDKCNIKS